ncbi:HSP20 family protein [Ereboglobus sp. PH5-5]|uniref:Hsp20/alpha crystallin family protein n=2 Tax=unclassified Ereboglobus TaxID=2626932 RepID=UPI002404B149|nr:Hsp20/alpha crystallin family protein [Ereboglobus sp. PH5-10]MDF9827957.1 HSP20 family protein [Ereboglobus sp. PH5-10]MDF9834260.1 HSP20 family protein [Ereboglobus sp. PH5-5]
MHTMIHTDTTTETDSSNRIAKSEFRNPHYDCQHEGDSMKLIVYVPGVDATGVDITMHGPDLTITARKKRFIRRNWNGLQLERVQRDYMLRLRVGYGYDPSTMTADLRNGILTLKLPVRAASVAPPVPVLAGAA